MAENAGFRIGFRGFDKQDVLNYIEATQKEAAERLNEEMMRRKTAEERVDAAQQEAKEAVAKAEEALTAAAEAEKALSDMQTQNQQLTVLAQAYKTEILQLRENAQHNEALTAARDRVAELEEQVAVLKAQNARYAKIVGDVNRVIVEARVVSASYLDAAQRKSTDCLKNLEVFLEGLKHQTVQAVEDSGTCRQKADSHIETLLADLQELGHSVDAEA